MDFGEKINATPIFRFENSWLLREGIDKIVCDVWHDPNITGSNIDKCRTRFRLLRPKLKGWNRNRNAWYIELKKDILPKLDDNDKHSAIFRLTAEDRNEQMQLRSTWDRLLKK